MATESSLNHVSAKPIPMESFIDALGNIALMININDDELSDDAFVYAHVVQYMCNENHIQCGHFMDIIFDQNKLNVPTTGASMLGLQMINNVPILCAYTGANIVIIYPSTDNDISIRTFYQNEKSEFDFNTMYQAIFTAT